MRCFFAILQLLLLSLPTFASAATLRGGAEANLPECCRRAGAHHCMMSAERIASAEQSAASEGKGFRARPQQCPYCPKAMPAAQHSPGTPTPSALFFAQIASHPTAAAQTAAKWRISQDRSRHKRGPPFIA